MKCLRGCLRESCCNDLFTWHDVVTILVQKRNKKNWKMTILWVLGDLWKEGGSLIKSGALCHDVIGSHDELMETLEKWNGKTLMGYGPQTYAFPTRGPTRSLCENPNRKWLSENLALVIFWKNGCFFNLPFLPTKHMNHTIQFAWKIVVTHQGKQEFEVRNKKSRTSKQAATCAYVRLPTQPLLHLMFLRICLRRTYAPSRITYAWMTWVPPQSKFHHLEKKRGSAGVTSSTTSSG